MLEWIKVEIDRLNKLPCKCIWCASCSGMGTILVNYDGLGRVISNSGTDDLSELEECPNCDGMQIVETCDRCREMEELYEMDDKLSERNL